MPFVGGDEPSATRKRGWTGGDDDDYFRNPLLGLYSPDEEHEFYPLHLHQHHSLSPHNTPPPPPPPPPPPRKISPPKKRTRITAGSDELPSYGDYRNLHPRPSPQTNASFEALPSLGNRSLARPSATVLTPCHICHRKPTKKSHIDSFAQCQGCGEQTCFICLRECQGWSSDDEEVMLCEQEVLSRSFHMDDVDDLAASSQREEERIEERREGRHNYDRREAKDHDTSEQQQQGPKGGWYATGHRGVVCSRCCIERGAEGDVVCLGCLSSVDGG